MGESAGRRTGLYSPQSGSPGLRSRPSDKDPFREKLLEKAKRGEVLHVFSTLSRRSRRQDPACGTLSVLGEFRCAQVLRAALRRESRISTGNSAWQEIKMKTKTFQNNTSREDVYTRVTNKIITELGQGS
jgi:hypothetical protein